MIASIVNLPLTTECKGYQKTADTSMCERVFSRKDRENKRPPINIPMNIKNQHRYVTFLKMFASAVNAAFIGVYFL